jgi:lipid-A-disaccharide synthase
VLLSAGEPSGDRLAAAVAVAARAARPDLEMEGPGGPEMAAAGVGLRAEADSLSAMGFGEVVRTLPRHYRLYRDLVNDARAGRYSAALLVDYPGFHLRLGRALRRAGVPVVWYVAPQLWAWRAGRLPALRAAADDLAVLLPFEAEWFGSRGLTCTFVGHPVAGVEWPAAPAARNRLGLPPEGPVLGIFPGSREGEIERNWPLFRDVAGRILAEGRAVAAVVCATPGGYYPEPGPIRVHRGDPASVFGAATAALAKSGTTTLELACAGVPMVVAYRTSISTNWLARWWMTVDRISLVNLIAGADLVPEFWRWPVSAEPVAAALRPLLGPASPAAAAQRTGLAAVRAALGDGQAASRVAAMLLARLPV